MTWLVQKFEGLSPAEMTGVLFVGGFVTAVTGGALAYALVSSESFILIAGTVVLATGPAAEKLAGRA